MDLSNPLATVTPTLDAAVLQALSANIGWSTGARVHRLGGAGSADGVRRVLARLVHQGIVMADEHDHATLYQLNRDHLAYRAIHELALLRATVFDRLQAEIDRWSPAPVHASLFGSFARGDADADSDIDLLIVRPGDATDDDLVPAQGASMWLTQVDELAAAILRWTGNRAQIIDITPERLAGMLAADDPLVESWRVEHAHLAGVRLLDLLRILRESHSAGPEAHT
jgi:Nucleotidyltransferase domain